MFNSDDYQLFDLIRPIDPDKFPVAAHKPGYVLCLDQQACPVEKPPGRLVRLFGLDKCSYYFVKLLDSPLEIQGWEFTLREPGNKYDLSVRVDCNIVTIATEESALKLAIALHHATRPDQALYELIGDHLDKVIWKKVEELKKAQKNIITNLATNNSHENNIVVLRPEIIKATAIAISKQIGCHVALTAFLKYTQPIRWEASNLKTEINLTEFDCSVFTISNIAIEVDDIVAWRQSEINNEMELALLTGKAIDAAIKDIISNQAFIDVFQNYGGRLFKIIKDKLRLQIRQYGYEITSFQTRLELGLADVKNGLILDLKTDDGDTLFHPNNDLLNLGVKFLVKIGDMKKILKLIQPNMMLAKIEQLILAKATPILSHVAKTYGEMALTNTEMGKGQHQSKFSELILQQMATKAMKEELKVKFGFEIKIIALTCVLHHALNRLMQLRGRQQFFSVYIRGGKSKAKNIRVSGTFMVMGIDAQNWHRFEHNDFGYHENSTFWLPGALINLMKDHGNPHSVESFDAFRQQESIQHELRAIRDTIANLLAGDGKTDGGYFEREWFVNNPYNRLTMLDGFIGPHINRKFGLRVLFIQADCEKR